MLRTYFQLKIKKYAFRLIFLQLLLSTGIIYYLQHHLCTSIQQTQELRGVLDRSNKTFLRQVITENEHFMNRMAAKTKEENRGEKYLKLAEEITAATRSQIIVETDVSEYKTKILQILEGMPQGMNEHDWEFVDDLLNCYLPSNFTEFAQRYGFRQSQENHRTYLKQLGFDLVLTEESLLAFVYDNNLEFQAPKKIYAPYIEGNNHLALGDSLEVKIELSQYLIGSYSAVIKGDTIPIGLDGKADFEQAVHKVGKHKLEGVVIYEQWGREFSLPFSHEYTVVQ